MSLQPSSGSLSLVLIRACQEHAECEMECPARERVDLGEVARFEAKPAEEAA